MNTFSKYCPNVFLAKCENMHEKGEIIIVTTKRCKEIEHKVHNIIYEKDGYFYYSITRVDGFNAQERAKKRVENLQSWAESAEKRADAWYEKAQEGKEFLSLGEPIKIGHHSEKRHRNLIERNHNRFGNYIKEKDKAQSYEDRIAYWAKLSETINLSMPESIEFFEVQLEEAKEYHQALKKNEIERPHSLALSYATKRVKELQRKVELAKKLWGNE